MNTTPTFAKPPIVELVLGAQFSPLTKLTSAHLGIFWKMLGEEWSDPSDVPPLGDQFETFDRPRWAAAQFARQLQLGQIFPGRLVIGHKNKDRLVQVQSTRFHLNWRKREGFYPSYKRLVAEFETIFEKFTGFVESAGVGNVLLNQWELTYIDAFPKAERWETPADWSKFLPGLFSDLFPTTGMDLALDNRAAEWSYELQPKLGRLYIAAQSGIWGDDKQDSLFLHTTARGPIGGTGVKTLRDGLDLGHKVAVETFLRVTDKGEQARWGIEQ
jgi:uncharacterized protein (TIGR04255 family)